MEREFVGLLEAAKKAADGAVLDGASVNWAEVDRCVTCLDVLKQFMCSPVTHDVLVTTRVAKWLRRLMKHPVEHIQTIASDVVDIWKKIVIDETTKKNIGDLDNKHSIKTKVTNAETVKAEAADKARSIKVERASNAGTIKIEKVEEGDLTNPGSVSSSENFKIEINVGILDSAKAEKIDRNEDVNIEKIPKVEKKVRIPDTVKANMKKLSLELYPHPKLTSLIKCNDAMRDHIREFLLEALSEVSREADEGMKDEVNACDPIRVAIAVESVMFEKMDRSNYLQKCRSIMFNLMSPYNPHLRRKVLLGQVKPKKLVNMTSEEMASDQRQIKENALFECELGVPPKASNDLKCGRCSQRKATYFQLQTGSGMPLTTYVSCVNCNQHWKFC